MPKSVTPGKFQVANRPIFASAVPDSFDARDLIYEPRLELLRSEIDRRSSKHWHVYRQAGQSCTGHAVAAVINHVLDLYTEDDRVSPYMLYDVARRYDELPGEADAGSSLRATFKGWFNHGVALECEWPRLRMRDLPDVDDERHLREWRQRPLGAFYRVNPFRLDDVQSAIGELTAIAVSGSIHDGWLEPVIVNRTRPDGKPETIRVIARGVPPTPLGGHAFAIVGYNDIGFLVQNSWGQGWGDRGFAYLPYEDWLDSAYDAWVARPGVPQTPLYSGRNRTVESAGAALTTDVGPDVRRLAYHVVNTGNDGALSADGKFKSSPQQLDKIVEHMEAWHEFFLARNRGPHPEQRLRHIVVWAHGGGVGEQSGLEVAEQSLNWWLNCGAFPITCVWETGGFETFTDAVKDAVRSFVTTLFGFNVDEQIDTKVEKFCRKAMRWSWSELKDNARLASRKGSATAGATLLVQLLKAYVDKHGADHVRIHLAAHSAGSVYQASMIQRMKDAGLTVATMTWLGPAITIAEFRKLVVDEIGPGKTVNQFACFDLSNALELDDTVAPVYHKSAVYLVARGFEDGLGQTDAFGNVITEVPLVGLSKWWDQPLDRAGTTLTSLLSQTPSKLIISRNGDPLDSRTDATTHADLPLDAMTMTSVAFRALGVPADPNAFTYQAHAPLFDPAHDAPWPVASPQPPIGAAEAAAGAAGVIIGGGVAGLRPGGRRRREADLLPTPVPGGDGGALVAGVAPETPAAPEKPAAAAVSPEVAQAPRTGRPILDILKSMGAEVEETAPPAYRKFGGI